MGKMRNGINGPFTGKVGPAVGTTWMGKPVLRSLPSRRTKPFSPKELQQQAKFSMMSGFLQPVISLLNVTFKQAAVQMTGFNKGFSYNVKNAISGIHPELKIDFNMVLLGRGDLPNVESPAVASPSAGNLEFTWTDNSGKGKALATDKAFAAAYCEEMKKWIYRVDLAERSAGVCTLDVTRINGKALHTYLGFISANGKDVTDTVFTGLVNV
jgi:Family of unknown function (DUF6266)